MTKKLNKNAVLVLPNREKMWINENMLTLQDAWKNLEQIKKLHLEIYKIFVKMKRSKKPETLKKLAGEVKQIEFQLQEAWNFPQDENFHKWFEVPGCTCPKMDNADMIGTDYNVHSDDCPIHGK